MSYKQKVIVSLLLELIGYGLAWYAYGWQLPLSILICIWANNITH